MLAFCESSIGKDLRRSFAILTVAVTALSVLPPVQVFAAQTSADSLQGYWKFDETSAGSFVDSSGGNKTGTGNGSSGTNNTPQPSTDVPSGVTFSDARSISFDGTDDSVSFSSFVPQARTISFWLKMRADANGPILYAGADAWDTGQWSWAVFQFPGSQLYFQSGSGSASIGDGTFALNTWNHYALVRSDGGLMKLYKNGVLAGSIANTSVIDSVLRMGKASTTYFNGLLDDVRIYSRNLSAREITDLASGRHPTAYWNGRSNTGFERAASWSGSYVPDPYSRIVVTASTGALTLTGAIKYAGLTINTGALMHLNGTGTTMLDSGLFTNYGTLALKNSETLTSFTNDTAKGTIMLAGTGTTTGFKTGTSYYNLTLNDGLMGYWKFDEASGTRAADSSGWGSSGTLLNGPTITTSTAPTNFTNGYALSLDGINDYVDTDASSLNITGPVTISVWIKPTAPVASGSPQLLVIRTLNSQYITYVMSLDATGKVIMASKDTDLHNEYTSSTTVMSTTNWNHVVGVYDGSAFKIYVNGVLEGIHPISYTPPSTPVSHTQLGHASVDPFWGYYKGLMDDVRIYNRALSTGEIAALAAGNQPSLQKAIITLNGDVTLNGSLTLNGGMLDVSSSNYGLIIGKSWLNNGGKFIPRSSTVTFAGTTSGLDIQSGGQSFAKLTLNGAGGTWNTRDRLTASGTTVLTNGTLDASGSYVMRFGQFAQVGGTITPRAGTIILTNHQNTTNTFTSTLNTLRIEDSKENGLVGYWKFDEGTNTGAILDSSGNGFTGTRRGTGAVVWTNSTLPSNITFNDPFAMQFNGISDYVNVGNSALLNPQSAMSFSAWVRFRSLPADTESWIIARDDASLGRSFAIGRNGGVGHNTFELQVNGGDLIRNQGDALTTGTWLHLAVTGSPTDGWKSFINGVQQGAASWLAPNATTGNTTIGERSYAGSEGFLDGIIDDVRLYNRALSSIEILNLARGRYAAGQSSTVTVTLGGNLSTAYLALDSGNLSMGSNTLSVTSNLSMLRGRGDLTLGNALTSLGGLTMSGAVLTSGAGTLDINGDILMLTGSLIAPSGYLTLTGNFRKTGGTFTANGGTVILDGGDQILSGTGTFYNLTKSVTSPATLTFGAGQTFTVLDTLVLNGVSSNLLSLRSSLSGVQWLLNAIGSTGAEYLDVQDSRNIYTASIDCPGCVDSTNNINWIFPVPVVSAESSSQVQVQSAGGGRGKGTALLQALRARMALLDDYKNTIVRESDPEETKEGVIVIAQKPVPKIVTDNKNPTIERQRDHVVLVSANIRVIYKDVVADAWYAPFVSRVIQDDVARGYKDKDGKLTGEFGIGNNVTRAEILKMVLEASGKNQLKAAAPRNPSARTSWAASYVGIAESLGLSTFSPTTDVNAAATRGEVIQLILEAMGITIGQTPAMYSDVPKDHPYSPAIAAATFFGLIVGDTKADGTPLNTFRPDQPINRAEVSKLIALTLALQKIGAIVPPAFSSAASTSSEAVSTSTNSSSSSSITPAAVPQLTQMKVIVPQLKVRIDSRANADWIATIYSGHVVTVLWPLTNGWTYIKTTYGKEGYVQSDALGPLQ